MRRLVLVYYVGGAPSHTYKPIFRPDYLPPIDVSVVIHEINDVNLKTNDFFASFTLMLDWEDPSL